MVVIMVACAHGPISRSIPAPSNNNRAPGEIKRREVELDPQISPEEIMSREVELGC